MGKRVPRSLVAVAAVLTIALTAPLSAKAAPASPPPVLNPVPISCTTGASVAAVELFIQCMSGINAQCAVVTSGNPVLDIEAYVECLDTSGVDTAERAYPKPKVVATPFGTFVVGTNVVHDLSGAAVTRAAAASAGAPGIPRAGVPSGGQPFQLYINGNGGYNNGGCTSNGTCSNLYLAWNATGYWNAGNNASWQGAASFNDLAPNSSPNDGYYYDFMDTLSNVTGGQWSICSLSNYFSSDTAQSSPISWWPTGGKDEPGNGSETVTLGGSFAGVNMSYSSTYNASQGYTSGNIWGNSGKPNFSSAWDYQNPNGGGASDCNWGSVAMEGGLGLRTPTSDTENWSMHYSAEVSGYEGT